MARRGGRAGDGFDCPEVRREMGVSQARQKVAHGFKTTLQHETQYSTEAAHLFARDLMLRMISQPGIKHVAYGRLLLQEARDLQGAFVLVPNAEPQGFHAAQ